MVSDMALRARAKSRQQLTVYAPKAPVAHDQHVITWPRRARERFDQRGEIVVEFRARSERRQCLGSVPTQVRGVAKYTIGRRKAGGQQGLDGSEFHGVRARLEHGENAAASHAPTQAIDGRSDGGRVVREVVVHRDATDRSAKLEPPLDAAKGRQRLETRRHRDSNVTGGGNGGG